MRAPTVIMTNVLTGRNNDFLNLFLNFPMGKNFYILKYLNSFSKKKE